jgi:hypothetical protein
VIKNAGNIMLKVCVSEGVLLLGDGVAGMRMNRATGVVRDIVC